MVVEEAHQRGRGKIEGPAGRDAPDGGAHRHEVKAQEIVAEAVSADEFIQRHRFEGLVVKGGIGHAEKAEDLGEELEEARTDQIGALGEDAVQTHAVVFHVQFFVAHAETHLGRFDGYAQLVEQAHQIRIGHLVEDHEPGVDRDAASAFVDFDRVRVAADVALALEDGHVVALPQKPRGPESGNPAADDGQAFFAHSAQCSVGVPADEPPTTVAGDGAATSNTFTPKPVRRCALPRGRRTRARDAGF